MVNRGVFHLDLGEVFFCSNVQSAMVGYVQDQVDHMIERTMTMTAKAEQVQTARPFLMMMRKKVGDVRLDYRKTEATMEGEEQEWTMDEIFRCVEIVTQHVDEHSGGFWDYRCRFCVF